MNENSNSKLISNYASDIRVEMNGLKSMTNAIIDGLQDGSNINDIANFAIILEKELTAIAEKYDKLILLLENL